MVFSERRFQNILRLMSAPDFRKAATPHQMNGAAKIVGRMSRKLPTKLAEPLNKWEQKPGNSFLSLTA